jgi:REP element-mobilizing transposase RayT
VAREKRVHYQGAVYHVIARGNNRETIFREVEDKRKHIDLLAKYKDKFGFELFAYVLMDNHFHLLLQVVQSPLMKIMQGIQQTYTQYFNRKYKHVGHVFQQRYKAFLCEDNAYLAMLVCYIHQNPCRAEICEGLDYAWSSHRDYMRGWGRLVNPRFALRLFDEDIDKAIIQYKESMACVQESPLLSVQTEDKNCMESLEESAAGKTQKEFHKAVLNKKLSLEDLVKEIAEETGVPRESLMDRCRARHVVAARNLLVCRAVKYGVSTRTELAKRLNLDPARITRICQETGLICKG